MAKHLSVREVAEESGVSQRLVRAEIYAGRLRCRKIGGRYVITRAFMEEWLNDCERAAVHREVVDIPSLPDVSAEKVFKHLGIRL